ncbi:hypothetical protein L6R52_30555 [Myxococcota bacterium]|nr:hypothetical protein [Myxococcota bacterium]
MTTSTRCPSFGARGFALAVALAACGDEQVTPPVTPLPCDALPEGVAPRITRFDASAASVAPYGSVELAWSVEGACIIDVESPAETLASTFLPSGTVASRRIVERTTFTLTARGRGATSTSSVTVDAAWGAPLIHDLSLASSQVALGDFVTLQWSTENERDLRVLENEREIYRYTRDAPPSLVLSGIGRQILTATTTYRLEISNPAGEDTRELVIRAGQRAFIEHFSVTPIVFVGQTIDATLTWRVSPPTATRLYVDGALREDFPGTAEGSWSMRVDGPRAFVLETEGSAATAWIAMPELEREPNEFVQSAHFASVPAIVGELSSSADVDVFEISELRPGSKWISTTRLGGDGCETNTRLVVSTFGDRILGEASDGGAPAPNGGSCAALEVKLGDGDPGTIFVEVHAEGGDRGPYLLLVE